MTRDASLALWQIRYEQRAFWRDPRGAAFTFALPLMLIVFFGSFGADPAWFVPGLLAYGIAMSTYSNLAITFAIHRDNGIIKRVQGTPLPWWTYLAGRVGSTAINAALMTAAAITLAILAYGVELPLRTVPGLVATLGLAVAAFTALGIGLARYIPDAGSAPAIATFSVLPLSFISGVWAPTDAQPDWLTTIASLFPLQPLGDGLRTVFAPGAPAGGVVAHDLLVLGAWLLVGCWAARRFFASLSERA